LSLYSWKKSVYKYLNKLFYRKGANFHFKARQVAREMELPSSVVGRACKELYEDGLIDCRNPEIQHARTWKTVF